MRKYNQKNLVFIIMLLIFLLLSPLGTNNIFADERIRTGDLKERIRGEYIEDELIIKYKGDSKPFRVVKLRKGRLVGDALRKLRGRADIVYAEPNYIAHALMVPNDSYYSYQWNLDNPVYGGINMEAAWDISSGASVKVAVVDTGIAYENYGRYSRGSDLAETCFTQGYDFVYNDSHANDDNGHGTHVAGTLAQSTNNNKGVAGVSFSSCLMPIKVLNKNGSGSYSKVASGIRYAADHGAKIINLSLGGSYSSNTLRDAVAYAYGKGVTIIAAAGNDGAGNVGYPARYDDYVIAVGATRYDETRAYYSNYGASLDIMAPGGDLNVDQNNDGYADGILQQTFSRSRWGYYFYQGTSMASPHVAGVAALIISSNIATSPDDVRNVLESTADDLGPPGRDNTYGYGLVNASSALSFNSGPVDNPPTVNINSPAQGSTVTGLVNITASATDDVGVAQVKFYVNSTLIGSDLIAPYEASWDSTLVTDGDYTIKAEAIDTASQATDDSINILVDNFNNPPIAKAGPDKNISDDDGNGSENATLDGSSSQDPDGNIVSYVWKEGSTILGNSSVINYNFPIGAHTLILTVVDDEGASDSDEKIVNVLANKAPIANAGLNQSGYVSDAINFNGSSSYDPDGSIVSYGWDFGDGETGSGKNANHSYALADTYTATLTITDNGGLVSEDTSLITITERPTLPDMHVGDISFTSSVFGRGGRGSYCRVTATVPVLDGSDSDVNGAKVYGNWTDAYSKNVTGTTKSNGQISFKTRWTRGCGTFTFSIDDIVKSGWLYNQGDNTETSDSITLP